MIFSMPLRTKEPSYASLVTSKRIDMHEESKNVEKAAERVADPGWESWRMQNCEAKGAYC